ncbi:unnamed protein product [Dimorphilus gyrociliatus]|uniref:Uncharacterized protein n=1 Tax=Dimorphilus gyrociliatus TaxID=2664684 RepID=A0A7I8VTP3_9ANNE|nr:unnamed protein product [Dimorphilus gyrociliatus]
MSNKICNDQVKDKLVLTEEVVDYLHDNSAISKKAALKAKENKKEMILKEVEDNKSLQLLINALRFSGQFQLASFLDNEEKIMAIKNGRRKGQLNVRLKPLKINTKSKCLRLADILHDTTMNKNVKCSCFTWMFKRDKNKRINDIKLFQSLSGAISETLMEESYRLKIIKFFEETLGILVYEIRRHENDILLQLICTSKQQLNGLASKLKHWNIDLKDDKLLNATNITDVKFGLFPEEHDMLVVSQELRN